MLPEFANRNDWLHLVRNKLTILGGCASAINDDTRNSPDARHKARLMMAEIETLGMMALHVREVRQSHTEGEEIH